MKKRLWVGQGDDPGFVLGFLKQKTLTDFSVRVLINKERQRLTLPDLNPVPSARVVLTSLFGMGRGEPHRHSHLKAVNSPWSMVHSPW